MIRRIFCILCCAMLCCTVLPSVADGHEYKMSGYDPADVYRDWNTNLFFERMKEKTGIGFTYRQYSDPKLWREAKASYQKDGELPDVLFKAELAPSECIQLLNKGVLIDLKPLLSEHAPNLWRLLQDNPAYLSAVTLPGGEIAALPYINTMPGQNCMWINREWLENLRLKMPTTAEEFVQVLTAFRDKDPNRNGKKDEIPLTLNGAYDLKYLAHAFGLVANDFNVWAQDGQAHYLPLDPAFQSFLSWCRDLHTEKLLDKECFSTVDNLRRVTDAKSTPVYGVLFAPMASNLLPVEWTTNYQVIPPLSYNGKQVYRTVANNVMLGAFALTSACPEPQKLLAWVDYLYTEEGATLANFGKVGEDYVEDGDGTWRKTESGAQTSFLSNVAISTGGLVPGISAEKFQSRYFDESVSYITSQIQLVSDIAKNPFPAVSLTSEDEAFLLGAQQMLGIYVDESIARFVMGEWELNEQTYASFIQQLKDYRVDEFIHFWQQKLNAQQEVSK